MKIFFQRKSINIMLFIALIILTIISSLSYFQIQELIKANAWVVHTHNVIENANEIAFSVIDAESKASLFLLTKDKKSIEDIPEIINKTNQLLTSIKLLVQDNPEQESILTELSSLINKKFTTMQEIINANMNNGEKIEIRKETLQQRLALKHKISEMISSLVNNELLLLDERNTLSIYNAKKSNIMLITAGILSEALFLISILLLNYYLAQKNKIELMKNEFISIVSHELRTPLTSIHGAVSLLTNTEVTELSDNAKQLLGIAKTNSERLIRLINDILDIEKIESGRIAFNLQNIELNTLISEAIAINQSYANKFSVKVEVGSTIPNVHVYADHDRLNQVLTNLISNAIKFSPVHETVTITTELKDKDTIRVNVTDKGKGIPEKFQSQIFQKFSQADSSTTRKHEGTGLGLNISKNITEKLGGNMYFKMDKENGTTFYFDLPMINSAQTKVHDTAVRKNTSAHPINILHIENDGDLTKIIGTVLGEHANIYSVETIKEAKVALASKHYDLVILDIKLPDGSTISLLPMLSQKKIPVVVFSAYEFPNEYMSYVHDVFVKSKTSNEELLNAIINIIKEKNYGKRTSA